MKFGSEGFKADTNGVNATKAIRYKVFAYLIILFLDYN